MKLFPSLEKLNPHSVHFVRQWRKKCFIYLVNFYMKNVYGIKLSFCFHVIVTIPDVTPQSARPGFIDTSTEHFLLINHLLLIYKYYLYKAREAF